jgi:hypothetical protein
MKHLVLKQRYIKGVHSTRAFDISCTHVEITWKKTHVE